MKMSIYYQTTFKTDVNQASKSGYRVKWISLDRFPYDGNIAFKWVNSNAAVSESSLKLLLFKQNSLLFLVTKLFIQPKT